MIARRNPIRSGKAVFLALLLSFYLCLSFTRGFAQSVPEPRRDQLLNGLTVLVWERPGSPEVVLKLRIHSGAAFDLAGKAGTMALLGDALFPDPTTREYITGELGGKLEVTTDYDAINVTLAARAQDYERLVELLRTAIISMSLTPDRVNELKEARLKLVRESLTNPTLIADREAAARLYRDYPYGRPYAGATETLSRIGRADVQYARERFLNPNNATLVIAGGVERGRAMRALRQLLGLWAKSDRVVPATFRQPEAPDARTLIVDMPGAETAEVRLAARGLARSDKDYVAASMLAQVARERWEQLMPELRQSAFFVRHEARVLPGIFLMGASVRSVDAARALQTAQKVLQDLAKTPPTAAELERARADALATFNRQMERPEQLANLWLDTETYKLAPVQERARSFAAVMPADLQRVAGRLLSGTGAGVATVVVGPASQMRAELERTGTVEVISVGEEAPPPAPSKTPNSANAPKRSR